MEMDIGNLWEHMPGFAKAIWIMLIFMSIWSLQVAGKKWWGLRKAQKETQKFAPEFSQFLEEDNLTEAINLAESYKVSHIARVLGGALVEVKPLIQDGSVTVADINSAERASKGTCSSLQLSSSAVWPCSPPSAPLLLS
jgi:biopolymer transport protein ExbB/biopolymer transport protein TolQ